MAAGQTVLGGVGSKVAVRLAVDYLVEAGITRVEQLKAAPGSEPAQEHAQRILEAGFKAANSAVYDFGHKLSAGGRMAASLVGISVRNSIIAAARVGSGSGYIYREGVLAAFFESSEFEALNESQQRDRALGINSLVAVDLASLALKPNDLIVVLSRELEVHEVQQLRYALGVLSSSEICQALQLELGKLRPLSFIFSLRVGPEALYLR
jgi:serine/threonine protein phosphatase PrpC